MEKMKTLTVGGVTYAVCAPLTEEEKTEVTQRVLDGISYEEILAPHREAIAAQAVQDVKAGLDTLNTELTADDFTIGRVSTTSAAFDTTATNGVGTQAYLPCTAAEPYSVTVNGIIADSESNARVVYYNGDKDIIGAVSGIKNSFDSLCDFATFNSDEKLVAQRDAIRYIRITILWPSANGAVTDANKADIVNQFTFVRKYSDPYVRQTQLSGMACKEDVAAVRSDVDEVYNEAEYYDGSNRICVMTEEKTTNYGITITPDGDVYGKYKLTGGVPTGAFNFNIYEAKGALPAGILRGHTYRIGKRFPAGVSMEVLIYANGAWSVLGAVNNKKSTTDIAIPQSAEGMGIRLRFTTACNTVVVEGVDGVWVETEMISASSGKYWAEKYHSELAPPPMLTIIDDDGHKAFYEHLRGVIQQMKIPIAAAIPVSMVSQTVTDEEGNCVVMNPDRMTWEQIEECALIGAEILSHTYGNIGRVDVEAQQMTVEQIAYDYRLAQAHLRHHGIHSEGLVFVKDSSNVEDCVTACKQVYRYGFKADTEQINFKGSTDRYGIHRFGATPQYTAYDRDDNGNIIRDENGNGVLVTKGHTLESLKGMINALVAEGTGWMVWMVHTSTGAFVEDHANILAQAIQHAIDNGIQIVSTEYGVKAYCD